MFIDIIVLSVIVALIRGIDLKSVGVYEIRGAYLFLAGILLEAASIIFAEGTQYIRYWLYLLSFVFLLAAVYANRDKWEFWPMGIGVFLNMLVIFINGGRMPVLLNAAKSAGLIDLAAELERGALISHVMITANTHLWFLGDIISVPRPYPRPDVLSIGDIFICIGLFFLLQDILVRRAVGKNGCTGEKA